MPEPFKLYLDQMFALDVAQALRHEGHDIIRASEVGQARADDQLILDKAIAEKRILVTLDEHFGDWVILPLSKHPGASNRANLGMCISYHITFTMSIYLFSYDRPLFSFFSSEHIEKQAAGQVLFAWSLS